jgi:hypothetical protein
MDLEKLAGPAKCVEVSTTESVFLERFLTTRKVVVAYKCLACEKPILLLATESVPEELTCEDGDCASINDTSSMDMDYTLNVLFLFRDMKVWGSLNRKAIEKLVKGDPMKMSKDDVRKTVHKARQFTIKYSHESGNITDAYFGNTSDSDFGLGNASNNASNDASNDASNSDVVNTSNNDMVNTSNNDINNNTNVDAPKNNMTVDLFSDDENN